IHGRFDGTCPISYSINYARDINKLYPGHALLHEYGNGHCCWTTYYDPSWRWTKKGEKDIGEPHGMNIYSWFLKHSITKSKAEKPKAVLQSNTASLILDGSQSTGRIDNYYWSQRKGPVAQTKELSE